MFLKIFINQPAHNASWIDKIQVSKEDLAEISGEAQTEVNMETAQAESNENEDVSLDQVSEAEEQSQEQPLEETENNS